MATTPTHDKIEARITDALETANSTLATFTERLSKDPTYAFTWADDAFSAAASRNVFSRLALYALHAKNTNVDPVVFLARIDELARYEVMCAAKSPARSTSPSANLMAQETAKAWTEVLNLVARLNGKKL